MLGRVVNQNERVCIEVNATDVEMQTTLIVNYVPIETKCQK
jgi:hypothetical protein